MKNNNSKKSKPRRHYYLKDQHNYKVPVKKAVFKSVMKISDRQRYLDRYARKHHFVSLDQEFNGENPYEFELSLLADAMEAAELKRLETIERVKDVIQLLDPEDQMIIDLYYYQEYDQKSISSFLGIKQSTVSKHLNKARLKFLKLWYLYSENE